MLKGRLPPAALLVEAWSVSWSEAGGNALYILYIIHVIVVNKASYLPSRDTVSVNQLFTRSSLAKAAWRAGRCQEAPRRPLPDSESSSEMGSCVPWEPEATERVKCSDLLGGLGIPRQARAQHWARGGEYNRARTVSVARTWERLVCQGQQHQVPSRHVLLN